MMLSWMWVVMVCSAGPMAVEKNEPEILPGDICFGEKLEKEIGNFETNSLSA